MGLISLIVGGIVDANRAVKTNKASNDDSYNNVVVDNKYSINVPSFLSPMKAVNEDVSLAYANKTLDIAFQIIDEPKTDFVEVLKDLDEMNLTLGDTLLDKMALVSLNNMFDVDKIEITDYNHLQINGLNAVLLNVFQKRTFFKDALYGSFAFVEGKDTLYQIIILSGGTSIRKLADKLEVSIHSFKEL